MLKKPWMFCTITENKQRKRAKVKRPDRVKAPAQGSSSVGIVVGSGISVGIEEGINDSVEGGVGRELGISVATVVGMSVGIVVGMSDSVGITVGVGDSVGIPTVWRAAKPSTNPCPLSKSNPGVSMSIAVSSRIV